MTAKDLSESETYFLKMRLNFDEKEELIWLGKSCFKEQVDVLWPLVQELVSLKQKIK